jgi:hypothetical protein
LGVSARIVENYSRSDGKFFPAAIQHVLGTLDPRIPQLGSWEQVELANNPGTTVYDLSGSDWSGIDISPAEIAAVDQAAAEAEEEILYGADGLELSPEQMDQILADAEAELRDNGGDYGLAGDGTITVPQSAGYELTLSNDEYERVLATAVGMAAEFAEAGDLASAAAIGQELGLDQIELSNGLTSVTELNNASFEREAIRLSQDRDADESAPLPGWRAPSAQQRLDSAYDRIAAGTYAPAGPYRWGSGGLEFASPGAAGAALARHRWAGHQPDPTAGVNGAWPCGSVDEFGRCAEPYHAADCGSLADTVTAQALIDDGVYARRSAQPMADANGRVWRDQDGQPMTLTDHIEAASGQRLTRGSLFESGLGHRELAAPARQALRRPGRPGRPGHGRTGRQRPARGPGLGSRNAAQERDRARSDPRALIGALSRGISPDAQWDMAGRRGAGSSPAGPAPVVSGL